MIGLTPDITAVEVARHGMLRLTFADGLIGEVDVLDRMRGPVFEQARTPAGFAAATVDAETGTVIWLGGADLALRARRGQRRHRSDATRPGTRIDGPHVARADPRRASDRYG